MDRVEAERIALSKGWFAGQPRSFQAALLHVAELARFEKANQVYCDGDPPGGFYCVVAGSFGIIIGTPHTGPKLSHILRPGWWFGEGPLFGGKQRLFGVRAMEPSCALHVPLAAGRELMRHPEGTWCFSQLSLSFGQAILANLSDLMIRRADHRVAAVLLRVTGAIEDRVLQPTGEMRLTQSDLAQMANASRDLVNRTLAQFEAAGWVRLGYNKVAILDPRALADFAFTKGGRAKS